MKTVSAFIVLFLVWCVVCAFWYLFWVKGLSTEIANINPHESVQAIIEILLMLLGSVLIGFAIGWALQQASIRKVEDDVRVLVKEKTTLQTTLSTQQEHIQKSESVLERARETFKEDFTAVSRENERLKTELEERTQEKEGLQSELLNAQATVNTDKTELRQAEITRQKLEIELEEFKKFKKETKEPLYSDFISDQQLAGRILADERDDLKEINGIGPGIEKKLNAVGIHSFRQLSELSPASVKEVSEAIMFFPGRIERDRWVEQASTLYLKKLRS